MTAGSADRATSACHSPPSALRSALFGRGLLYVLVWSLQIVGSTLVSPVLAHVLGPAEFGMLASVIALYQVLLVLAVSGLDQTIVLRTAQGHDAVQVRRLLAFGMAIAVAVAAVAVATSPLWSRHLRLAPSSSLLVAGLLWVAPGAAVQLVLAVLLSQDRFRAFACVSGISGVGGQVVGIALLLGHTPDAGTYAWGGVVSQFTAAALGAVLTRPSLSGIVPDAAARKALSTGLPLMAGSLSLFVLNAGDRIIIANSLGPTAVGRYQVAYVVGDVVALLLTFVNQAWAPRILAVSDERERWRSIRDARDNLYRLLVPVFLAVNLQAPLLLRVVAPSSFRPQDLLLVVALVSAAAFPIAASGASASALLSLELTRVLALASAAAAVVNIAGNLLLIVPFGLSGAAVATLVAFAVQAGVQRYALRGRVRAWGTPGTLLGAVAATCASGAALTLPPQDTGWMVARSVAAACCVVWFAVRLRGLSLGTAASGRSEWRVARGRHVAGSCLPPRGLPPSSLTREVVVAAREREIFVETARDVSR
jgi:O-antigen/teichoic acid export membrane protein